MARCPLRLPGLVRRGLGNVRRSDWLDGIVDIEWTQAIQCKPVWKSSLRQIRPARTQHRVDEIGSSEWRQLLESPVRRARGVLSRPMSRGRCQHAGERLQHVVRLPARGWVPRLASPRIGQKSTGIRSFAVLDQ